MRARSKSLVTLAYNHIGFAFDRELENSFNVMQPVLAITFHGHEKKRRHTADARLQSAAIPSIDFMMEHMQQ